MEHYLAVARLAAPWKLGGDCRIHSLSGEWDHILALEGQEVLLRGKGQEIRRRIQSIREVQPHMVVKFVGIDSPEAVRPLSGLEILVDRAHAAPLENGEWYASDLVGLQLRHGDLVLGEVLSTWDNGGVTMLECRTADSRKVMVPFMGHYVGQVEIAAGWLEITTPWILE